MWRCISLFFVFSIFHFSDKYVFILNQVCHVLLIFHLLLGIIWFSLFLLKGMTTYKSSTVSSLIGRQQNKSWRDFVYLSLENDLSLLEFSHSKSRRTMGIFIEWSQSTQNTPKEVWIMEGWSNQILFPPHNISIYYLGILHSVPWPHLLNTWTSWGVPGRGFADMALSSAFGVGGWLLW